MGIVEVRARRLHGAVEGAIVTAPAIVVLTGNRWFRNVVVANAAAAAS